MPSTVKRTRPPSTVQLGAPSLNRSEPGNEHFAPWVAMAHQGWFRVYPRRLRGPAPTLLVFIFCPITFCVLISIKWNCSDFRTVWYGAVHTELFWSELSAVVQPRSKRVFPSATPLLSSLLRLWADFVWRYRDIILRPSFGESTPDFFLVQHLQLPRSINRSPRVLFLRS